MKYRASVALHVGTITRLTALLALAALIGACGDGRMPPGVLMSGNPDGGIDVIDAGIGDVPVGDGADALLLGDAVCTGTNCFGTCVDTRSSPLHCRACGIACPTPTVANAVPSCSEGRCNVTVVCAPDYLDCDGIMANGCEVRRSPLNCAGCGNVCPGGLNAMPGCMNNACTLVCNMGFGDCRNGPMDGCETDLRTTSEHCMACNSVCTIGMGVAHAQAACVGSACSFACDPGFGNCDGMGANGCETSIGTDTRNCGRCGAACDGFTNATGMCTDGRCSLVCNMGFADCDGMMANGCEVNTSNSLTHCGRCMNVCPMASGAAPTCTGGTCGFACNAGTGDCNGVPTDGCETAVSMNTEHCGRCANVCPAYPNGMPSCVLGMCRPVCAMGFGNCDGMDANGCETDIRTSAPHCGACGRACPTPPNAEATCAMMACGVACNAGFANCDGNVANGCEVDIRATAAHCGACGRACTVAHATAGCAASACTVMSCDAGFHDCDRRATNGCESTVACPADGGAP